MPATTIRIMHNDKAITSFVRDDNPVDGWREEPVLSDKWKETDAAMRISDEPSNRRGGPRFLLDKAAHAPGYCGTPYLAWPGRRPLKLMDRPEPVWWANGNATFSMPRDGDMCTTAGVVRIKYEFPDGGQPIWHHNVAAALDMLATVGRQQATVAELRRVLSERNRRRHTDIR